VWVKKKLDNIKDAFERSWIGLGPRVSEFEDAWGKTLWEQKAAIGLNSATAALHLALRVFRLSQRQKKCWFHP
jgi:perosamine synthetase